MSSLGRFRLRLLFFLSKEGARVLPPRAHESAEGGGEHVGGSRHAPCHYPEQNTTARAVTKIGRCERAERGIVRQRRWPGLTLLSCFKQISTLACSPCSSPWFMLPNSKAKHREKNPDCCCWCCCFCCLHIKNHPGLVSIQYLLLSQHLCTHPVTYPGQFPWSQANLPKKGEHSSLRPLLYRLHTC